MGFFSKWFNQAAQLDTLGRDLDFEQRKSSELEKLLIREEDKNALLEKEIKRVNTAKDKIVLRYADQVSKQVGLPQHFVSDVIEKPVKDKPEIDLAKEAQITWLAEENRQADIDRGIEPQPIEWYEDILRENFDKYVVG